MKKIFLFCLFLGGACVAFCQAKVVAKTKFEESQELQQAHSKPLQKGQKVSNTQVQPVRATTVGRPSSFDQQANTSAKLALGKTIIEQKNRQGSKQEIKAKNPTAKSTAAENTTKLNQQPAQGLPRKNSTLQPGTKVSASSQSSGTLKVNK